MPGVLLGKKVLVAIITLMGFFTGCKAQDSVSTVKDSQIVAPLISIARANKVSIFVQYHASCSTKVSQHIPLRINVSTDVDVARSDAFSAVRLVMHENKGLLVGQGRPGIIDVKSTNVSPMVL